MRMRLTKGGPWVGACIRYEETTVDPDFPENDMTGTRPRFLAAFIDDKPVALSDVWEWRGETITEAEYRYLCALSKHAVQYEPSMPEANPRQAINLRDVPLPF